MKARNDFAEFPPVAKPAGIKVIILNEDFATGVMAKRLVGRLFAFLECGCECAESIWRTDLLEFPNIADEAARNAADCHYYIVSLRGDHAPSPATRRWIESQVDGAAERGAALIILTTCGDATQHDQGQRRAAAKSNRPEGKRRRRVASATCRYFHAACSVRGAAFLSIVADLPASHAMRLRDRAAEHNAEPSTGRIHALLPA